MPGEKGQGGQRRSGGAVLSLLQILVDRRESSLGEAYDGLFVALADHEGPLLQAVDIDVPQRAGLEDHETRGSKYAWSVRIISVDALVRLLTLKEEIEDPKIIQQISAILIPREFTKLDFIHLHLNKKQSKLSHLSATRMGYAYPASRIYHDSHELCSGFLQTDLAARRGSASGCDSGSGSTDSHRGPAGDGVESGEAF